MTLAVVGYILVIWLVTFLIAFLPTRWIGKWIVAKCTNVYLGLLFCIKLTTVFVVWVSLFVMIARFESLPNVTADRRGFVYYFTSVLFALPVFAALALGFWRARHNSLNSHHQAMSVS
jgi:hypothetical protein